MRARRKFVCKAALWGLALAGNGLPLTEMSFSQQSSSGSPQSKSLLPPRKSQTIESRSLGEEIATPEPEVRYRIEGGAFVSRTDNGGSTWFGGQVDWNAQLVAGSAPSPYVCWVVGSGGDIYVTTDGANWRKVRPPAELDFVGVSATNAHTAVIIAADGRQFRTKNAGRSWHLMT